MPGKVLIMYISEKLGYDNNLEGGSTFKISNKFLVV